MISLVLSSLGALSLATGVIASPHALWPRAITNRATPSITVKVNSTEDYCMVMPRTSHTDIGDSEHPGGMQSYCSTSAQRDESQGLLPDNFWSHVKFQTGGDQGRRYAQLTGCIRPETVDRLNPSDAGGQYDSSGGRDMKGNPAGSVCEGYNHYVELVEPAGNRACIRCCDDSDDCPVHQDTSGCPKVIPGDYSQCS